LVERSSNKTNQRGGDDADPRKKGGGEVCIVGKALVASSLNGGKGLEVQEVTRICVKKESENKLWWERVASGKRFGGGGGGGGGGGVGGGGGGGVCSEWGFTKTWGKLQEGTRGRKNRNVFGLGGASNGRVERKNGRPCHWGRG